MATFELIGDGTYKVEGKITREDVDKINAFQMRTNLVLQNTKGQYSEIIKLITTDNAYFSVLGGVDYYKKEKFNNDDYRKRTQSNPKGLAKILQYFESIEAEMNPDWTDMQKCMYAYSALAVDIDYVANLKQNILSDGVTERSLNGVLYGQLTCAGMAKTFKEMMDRIGINCYYQNQRSIHAFNVVELDGKFRGVDVTWDCTKRPDENCSFKNFGRNPNFYKMHGHQIAGDSEETILDLTTFTDQEIEENYSVIESAINNRKRIDHPFRSFDNERKRKFLPVDTFLEEMEEEKEAFIKLRILSKLDLMPPEIKDFSDVANQRYGFVDDYIGSNHGSIYLRTDIEDDIGNRLNINGCVVLRNNQVGIMDYEDGKRGLNPLEKEQQEAMALLLYGDIKEYYTQFFQKEAPKIDDLIETYSMLESLPPEMATKVATLKAHISTEIKLLAYGDNFFEQLGISKEETKNVSQKAKDCLEGLLKPEENDPVLQHEKDLDFLYAIIQNDIIDVYISGQEYGKENLTKLMEEVGKNWKDAKFSDEEFKKLINEALSKTVTSEDISRSTVDLGVGMEEINTVIGEMNRYKQKEKMRQKSLGTR